MSIYTDGSCMDGYGGWAYCLLEDGYELCVSGGETDTTNNRMEMMAVIEALRDISDGNYTIYSDSMLVINCSQGKWKRKANLDLWSKYDVVSKGKKISWIWVKGHNGDKYNEIVDKLAKTEAKKLKK